MPSPESFWRKLGRVVASIPFADELVVPAVNTLPIADGVTFEQAALTEPCCVAFNAVVNNVRIRPGDRVVVLGPGPIGILAAAMARLCGGACLPFPV